MIAVILLILEKHLEIEIQSAQRSSQPLSLLVIDIDNFKAINDVYGHDIGDLILRKVASTMDSSLTRTTDFIARFGGEEFIVLMPSTDAKGAFKVAERIRKSTSEIQLPEQKIGKDNPITVSIGISTLSGMSLDKNLLFKQADTALYQAKESGKNKSIMYHQ